MKAQELRIGSTYQSVKFNTPVTLTAEDIAELVSRADGANIEHYIKEMFEPIELTEEWLVKFGWAYYNGMTSGDLTKDFGGKLDVDFISGKLMIKSHYDDKYLYRELFNIKYIHQLQNLYFVLSDEELTIKENG